MVNVEEFDPPTFKVDTPRPVEKASSDGTEPSSHLITTLIVPPTGWVTLNLPEIWRYRDLLFLLIWRDISARYRQSVVGYGWAIIKPTVSILIFTIVFGRLANLPSDGVPYPLFALAALIPWSYFAASLAGVSTSVTGGSGLLTKVYFPRLILPLSSLGAGLADLAIQLFLLAGLMAWRKVAPNWPLLLLPAFVLLTIAASLAFGLWLTALNVRYRDVGHAVPFLLQIWMWLSPVVYTSHIVPVQWRWVYALNPLVAIIDGFRWCVLGTPIPSMGSLILAWTTISAVLITGLIYFRRQEATFADIV